MFTPALQNPEESIVQYAGSISPIEEPLPEDDGYYRYQLNEGITINYENLKDSYVKYQFKFPKDAMKGERDKKSQMRVDCNTINIRIRNNAVAPGVQKVKVYVHREENALAKALEEKKRNKYVEGNVVLEYECHQIEDTTWLLCANLDSVYEVWENGEPKEVYALSESNDFSRNFFQLSTELYNVIEGSEYLICKKTSKKFFLKSDRRKPKQNEKGNGRKRKGSNCYVRFDDLPEEVGDNMELQAGIAGNSGIGVKQKKEKPLPDGDYNTLHSNHMIVRESFQCNIMKAKGKQDLGYRYRKKSGCRPLNEGDVVGIFTDEQNKTCIDLLDENNIKWATNAGIITRSFYLETAAEDNDEENSDVICVLGIVPVRVIGPTSCGDELFAYPKIPGCAATAATMDLDRQDAGFRRILLGQALEPRYGQIDEECQVPSFCSVVHGVDGFMMSRMLQNMYSDLSGKVNKTVKKAAHGIKSCVFWLKLLLIAIFAIIAICLWQRYGRNTLLRGSICKRDSLDQQTMVLHYSESWQAFTVTGLEFKFHSLNRKLSKKIKPRKGNYRYFINYERCCNRGISYGNEYLDNTPVVGGPEVLSADSNCSLSSLAYFLHGKWYPMTASGRHIYIQECHGEL